MSKDLFERKNMRDEYKVEGLPPSILGQITKLINATDEYAWMGVADPADHGSIEEQFCIARYNLERTIKTYLEKAKK